MGIELLPTALYRLFDGNGRLLYIGITYQLTARFASHRVTKEWWSDVARADIEWHPRRSAAEIAEGVAIRIENPLWNKSVPAEGQTGGAGRPKWVPPNAEVAAEIAHVVAARDRTLDAKAAFMKALADLVPAQVPVAYIAAGIGVERKTIYRYLERLRNQS